MAQISRETFGFTQDFQDLILACVLKRHEFNKYASMLSPKFFIGSISTLTARAILDYHKRRKAFPTKEVLMQLMAEEAKKLGDDSDSDVREYVLKLFKIRTLKVWEEVHSKVVPFCRERAVLKAFKLGIDHFKAGEEPEGGYVKLFEEAEAVGRDLEEPSRSLFDLNPEAIDPADTLLGNRWLCRGGAALFVGPSGIGKSSAAVQMMVHWAMGRSAFGIKPTGPLKILYVQAENDDGDLYEMMQGVLAGLKTKCLPEELSLVRTNLRFVTERAKTGSEFLEALDGHIGRDKPDLACVDPLLAFLGGDPIDTKVTAKFLRAGLNPLLTRHGCGLLICHHTPKATRETSGWRSSDWAYAGAGSADVTNWARAVLVVDPTHDPRTFRFIAGKRATRIGWIDKATLERQNVRHYCHGTGDTIRWTLAKPDDLVRVEQAKPQGVNRSKATPGEMMALVPVEDAIEKNKLLELARKARIGENWARILLNSLVESGQLFVHLVKRSGTNPIKMIPGKRMAGEETFTETSTPSRMP